MRSFRNHEAETLVATPLVVILHVFRDRDVYLQKTPEVVLTVAPVFQDRVEGLDVGIHVRRVRRNPLVDKLQFIACLLELLATSCGPLSILTEAVRQGSDHGPSGCFSAL